jgi:hypothetical protein
MIKVYRYHGENKGKGRRNSGETGSDRKEIMNMEKRRIREIMSEIVVNRNNGEKCE